MRKATAAGSGLVLRLYIAGEAPNSLSAIANVNAICEAHFPTGYNIEIVDMLQQPLRALANGIIVTPTLLRLAPTPVRRLIGNLSDAAQVLLTLVNK